MHTKDKKTSILPLENPRLPTGNPEPTAPTMQRSAGERSVLNTSVGRGNFGKPAAARERHDIFNKDSDLTDSLTEVAPAESNTTARPLSSQKTPNGPPKSTHTTTHINPAGPSKNPSEGGNRPTTIDPQSSAVEATPNGPPKTKETTVTYYKTATDSAETSPANISGTTFPEPPVAKSPELPPSTAPAMFGPDISTTTYIDQSGRTYETVDGDDRPTSTYSDKYGDIYSTTESSEIKICDKPSEVTSSTLRGHQQHLTDASDDGDVKSCDTPTTADSTAEPDSVYQIATALATMAAAEPDSLYSVETASATAVAAEPDSVYSIITTSATMAAEPDSVYSIASATAMAAAEPDSVYNIATPSATVSTAAEPDSIYNIATPQPTISKAAEPDSVYDLPTATFTSSASTSASISSTLIGPISPANNTALTTAFTRPGFNSALYGSIVAGADDRGRDGFGHAAPPLPFTTPGGMDRGVGVVTGTPVGAPEVSSVAMGLLAGRILVRGLSGK